jgi:periplasmic divalent cation tolerance protein
MDSYVLAFSTCPEERAGELARLLVEKGVAACVNVLPGVRSVYRWQGEIQEESEALLLMKAARARWAELERILLAAHPYEVPELVAVELTEVSPAYAAWLKMESARSDTVSGQ